MAGLAVVMAVLVAYAGYRSSPAPVSGDAADAPTREGMFVAVFGKQADADIPHFVTGLENLPASLQGTEVDGALETDADGHLRITLAVRRVFDYFLTAVGEEPLDTVLARLRAYIRDRLPPGAAAEAEKMLAGYLAYKQALAGIQDGAQPAGGRFDEAAVRASLQQARALRGQYMPPAMATAFYADEDAMNDYMLERVAILQDAQLAPAERAGRLAAREAQLPAPLREATHTVNQYRDLQALTADWKKQAGSATELRQIRENLLGAEAADRLEELDRGRADWDRRLDAWLAERAGILAVPGLDEADRHRQIDALRAEHFSADEQPRVEALEHIADQGALAAVRS